MSQVYDHVSGRLGELDKQVVAAVPPGGNWRNLPDDFPSKRIQQIREGSQNGGGSRSTYYGRLQWNKPSYTINTYITRPGNGCFIHPAADRLITVREAARLQTFPDATRLHGTLRARCTQIGNAVPPLLAYHLGSALRPGLVVDLFAGAGGLGLGLSLAGHRILLSAEIDAQACKTLAGQVMPGHDVVQADLTREADLDDVVERTKRLSAELDLVVGGPPCQGFSTAGPCRVGDPRNRLVLSFLQFVERTRPAVVLMENVPALRWRGATFLEEVCDRLAAQGYVTDTVILHAEAYGVPQLRRRLIVQATLEGTPAWPAPSHALLEPAFPSEQPATSGKAAPNSVWDAIGDLPATAGEDLSAPVEYACGPFSGLQRWARGEIQMEDLAATTATVNRVSEVQGRLLIV